MYYQNIDFLIAAQDLATAQKIGMILGRKKNTRFEIFHVERLNTLISRMNYFTCLVFNYQGNTEVMSDLVNFAIRKQPFSPVILFSFEDISPGTFKYFIRNGVTDILSVGTDQSTGQIQHQLLESLNYRWRLFRYLERERRRVYQATVVTTHHEMNQPLTVISNSINLLKMELKKDKPDPARIQNITSFLVKGAERLQSILTQLKEIQDPVLKEYTKGVQMLQLLRPPSDATQTKELIRDLNQIQATLEKKEIIPPSSQAE